MKPQYEKCLKILQGQRRYREPGEARGGIAYINRQELANLAGISADNLDVRELKMQVFEDYGKFLQPYYTYQHPSGDGCFILMDADSPALMKQRASDSLAMTSRHQGEKDFHSDMNAIALAGTKTGNLIEALRLYHKTAQQTIRDMAQEEGLELTDEEVDALMEAAV